MHPGALLFGLFLLGPLVGAVAGSAWHRTRAWRGPLVATWVGLAAALAAALSLYGGAVRTLPEQWAVVCVVLGGGIVAWVGLSLGFALSIPGGRAAGGLKTKTGTAGAGGAKFPRSVSVDGGRPTRPKA